MKTVTVTVCSVATRNQVVVVRASLSVKAVRNLDRFIELKCYFNI